MAVSSPSKLSFTPLSPLISFSLPDNWDTTSSLTTINKGDPQLIILFGWLEALPKHLIKYAEVYRTLYPSTPILMLRSTNPSFFFGTSVALKPAQDYILSLLGEEYGGADVLLHAFSNGGCKELVKLNSLFQPSPSLSTLLPSSLSSTTTLVPTLSKSGGIPGKLLIFDSCPGQGDTKRAMKGFTMHLRSRWVRWPAKVLVGTVIAVWDVFNKITGTLHPLRINSNALISSLPSSISRLYLYSEADPLVYHTDVEDHMKESEEAGIRVKGEKWVETAHVAHARERSEEGEGVRYWKAIRGAWEEVVQKEV